ncbi:MAG TPA: ABC transporter permease [Thermoanaerobaculia bacterium]
MALRAFVVLLCLLPWPDLAAATEPPPPNLLAVHLRKARSDVLDSVADRLLEKALTVPGVRSAAILNALPERDRPAKQRFLLLQDKTGSLPVQATTRLVSPDYFRTTGLTVIVGRSFADRDDRDSVDVAVVSRKLAEQAWPGENAIGKRFALSGDPLYRMLTVVGVVIDPAVPELGQAGELVVYRPIAQVRPAGSFVLLVRAEGNPHKAAPPLRELIAVAFGEELRSDGVRVISRAER